MRKRDNRGNKEKNNEYDLRNVDLPEYNFTRRLKDDLFILSDNAKQRLECVCRYIDYDIPVVLEGPTGSAKTSTVVQAVEFLGKKLLRYNASGETTVEDLYGRIVSDPDRWGSFGYVFGDYIQAYRDGYCFLIDEINLAPDNVFCAILDSIENECIELDIPGSAREVIPKHPDFRIIATQNPNKGKFQAKRIEMSEKFKSIFRTVQFSEMNEEELINLANELSKKYNCYIDMSSIVKIHYEWSNTDIVRKSPYCFTLRDIISTIECFSSEGISIYESVLFNYGFRFSSKEQLSLKTILKKHKLEFKNEDLPVDEELPDHYHDPSHDDLFRFAMITLKRGRNIIINGKSGTGLTFMGKLIAQMYSKEYKFYVCTKETSISDLVGKYIPKNLRKGELEWIDGPLVQSMENGEAFVFDRIDASPPPILEKLNLLLDQNLSKNDVEFDLPENPHKKKVLINPKFRIIGVACTSTIEGLSPAFLNRFSVLFLNDI